MKSLLSIKAASESSLMLLEDPLNKTKDYSVVELVLNRIYFELE